MKSLILLLFISLYACFCPSCRQAGHTTGFPTAAIVRSEKISPADCTPPVYIGGYGSSMNYNEQDSTFWLLTDRGPNVDGPTPESKVFALPGYTPHVGVFRLQGDSLLLIRKILLRDSTGLLFTGLPNTEGNGITGETAYDLQGRVIRNNGSRGIDPEGLALAPDGTFWISDEYGPYLLHFAADGTLLEEISPFNGRLPAHYAYRRPNRGMEGLAINKNGTVIYGIMQSPLNQPDGSAPIHSSFIRIITLSTTDHYYKEFGYLLENHRNMVSEIAYLNDTTFLVLERDGEFPGPDKGFKKIYRIHTENATDLASYTALPEWKASGTDSVQTVKKELCCDILQRQAGYPHDKPEGICVIGDSILCVVNDDDFGITAPQPANGTILPKQTKNGQTDQNKVYFIRLQH